MRNHIKIISVLLCLMLLISTLPMSVSAAQSRSGGDDPLETACIGTSPDYPDDTAPALTLGKAYNFHAADNSSSWFRFVPDDDMFALFKIVSDTCISTTYSYDMLDSNMQAVNPSAGDGDYYYKIVIYKLRAKNTYYFNVKNEQEDDYSLKVTFDSGAVFDDEATNDEATNDEATVDEAFRDFEYELAPEDWTIRITKYKGNSEEVVVPSALDVCPVTRIGEFAFRNCQSVKKVILPDSITEIENDAFSGCSGLTDITIPETVTQILSGAFENCSGLKHITFPDSVYEISQRVFSGCSSLEDFTISESVGYIGDSAFSDCTSLTAVYIPDNVISIRNWAFSGCTNLTEVRFPASINKISDLIFYNCTGLKSFTIPDTVTTIGRYSFENSGLTSITIPKSVKTIEPYAFTDCVDLAEVTIGDSVTTIKDEAFRNCSALSKIDIPDSVISIGNKAFACCEEISEITVPASVQSIGKMALGYTQDSKAFWNDEFYPITGFVIHGYSGSAAEKYAAENGFQFDSLGNVEPIGEPELKLNKTSTAIINNSGERYRFKFVPEKDMLVTFNSDDGENAYGYLYDENMQLLGQGSCGDPDSEFSYSMEYNVKANTVYYFFVSSNYLDSCTFEITPREKPLFSYIIEDGDAVITRCMIGGVVEIPATLEGCTVWKIGENAFINNTALTEVILPDTIQSIGSAAFYGCSSLTSIRIPASVDRLNDFTFYGCTSLESVILPNRLRTIGDSVFTPCTSLKSAAIPASVSEIGWRAFGYDYYQEGEEWKVRKIDGFMIYGYQNTAAETYADENGFPFMEMKPGDVDGDGVVTVMDVTEVQHSVSMMNTKTPKGITIFADVDKNGLLEIIDATWMQRWIAGIDIPFNLG